ncbi:MAG: alcohol dehydrogenase catalytic domain-containing protein [Nocardioidaceae bacterium]
MKAVVYKGTRSVAVEEVPDAKVEQPTDAVIRITTTNICGSDLHMYEGRAGVEVGKVLGHENMGIVEEVAPGVDRVKVGDRVPVPFNIACGSCRSCNEGWTRFVSGPTRSKGCRARLTDTRTWALMTAARPSPCGSYADFNLLELPAGTALENDFTMLSDIFPTAWHGTELAGMQPGDRVAVFGAGPVGLLAAHSARIRGAREVFVVDQHPDRLKLAEHIDTTPVDFSKGDPVSQIMEATNGAGVDCGVEAVGWQAHDPTGEEHPELVLDNLVQVVKAHGGLGVVGLCPGGSRGADRTGPGRPGRVRLWDVLHQGPAHGHRAGAGEALQPAAARPDRGRPRQPRVPRLARAGSGSGSRGVRELRQP